MIVHNRKPVSLAEVKALANNLEEKKVLNDYLKTFCKASKSDAEKLAGELRALNNMKLKEESIIKIADFLPRSSEELNKITNDVSLTEEEANSVLNIVKNY